jgi:diacylglycerol kinase family enzyme
MLESGKTQRVDVGKIVLRDRHRQWQRFFINACDAGLGGNVVSIANSALKHLGGFLTFLSSSLVALATYKPEHMKIWVDGMRVDSGRMTIVGALNGQFFGGGMHAAPMAQIDDGILDCIYVKNTNIFKFVARVLAKVYTGEHLRYHNVRHCRGKELRIVCEKAFRVDVDGEEEKAQELVITLVPRALRMRVPGA